MLQCNSQVPCTHTLRTAQPYSHAPGTALILYPHPLPSDPWLKDKLTVFHQKGGVSLVLLVMREVEGDEDTGQHMHQR